MCQIRFVQLSSTISKTFSTDLQNKSLSTIRLRLTGRTTGYMAVGFNAKANMAGADMLVAFNDGKGGVRVLVSLSLNK